MKHRYLATSTLVFAALLSSCEPDYAKDYMFGRVLPNVRFTLVFDQPIDRETLYERCRALANDNDFSVMHGEHHPSNPDRKQTVFTWRIDSEPNPFSSVRFLWDYDTDTELIGIELMLSYDSLEPLSLEDWKEFKRWRDIVLPEAFPDASITVKQGPEFFTNPGDLHELSRESGVRLD